MHFELIFQNETPNLVQKCSTFIRCTYNIQRFVYCFSLEDIKALIYNKILSCWINIGNKHDLLLHLKHKIINVWPSAAFSYYYIKYAACSDINSIIVWGGALHWCNNNPNVLLCQDANYNGIATPLKLTLFSISFEMFRGHVCNYFSKVWNSYSDARVLLVLFHVFVKVLNVYDRLIVLFSFFFLLLGNR